MFTDLPTVTVDFDLYPKNSRFTKIYLSSLPGEGEHAFLQVQKCGQNTDYVARQLAQVACVRQHDVGYAGLKDRHAVTTQWFSVWLPGKADPDWTELETDHIKVLQAVRHARKLKRGVLSGNRFEITIRDWQADKEKLITQ